MRQAYYIKKVTGVSEIAYTKISQRRAKRLIREYNDSITLVTKVQVKHKFGINWYKMFVYIDKTRGCFPSYFK